MDIMMIKARIIETLKKYKYVCIVLLSGILLMMLPANKKTEAPIRTEAPMQQEMITMEEKLEEMLGYLKGAGKVKVMLSVEKGEQTIYQTDSTYSQDDNNTDTKTQTIITTDSDRNETGLVHQINPPIYLGAIVLAQGADDPMVKLSIVEAVSKATGLGADKISVLRMQ